jgi:hypothetical protein
VIYRLGDSNPATCLQVPVYLENITDDLTLELTELRIGLEVSDAPGTLSGALDQPMLIVNAFAPARRGHGHRRTAQPGHSNSPTRRRVRTRCPRVPPRATWWPWIPHKPSTSPKARETPEWTTTNTPATGEKTAVATAGGAVFGTLAPGDRVLVAVVVLPIGAQPQLGTFSITPLANPVDSIANLGYAAIVTSSAKGGDPQPGPITGAIQAGDVGSANVTVNTVNCTVPPTVTDTLDNDTSTTGVTFKYRDPALGGVGGGATVTINHPAGIDRILLGSNTGLNKQVTPTGTQTTVSLNSGADGWPPTGSSEFTLTTTFWTEYPPLSGTFYDGTPCETVHAWEQTTCELIANPGFTVTAGTPVSFNVVLRNVRLDGGLYGKLLFSDGGPSIDAASLTVPGTALLEALTFFNVLSIPSAAPSNNGTYSLSYMPAESDFSTVGCFEVLSVNAPSNIALTGNTVEENLPAGTPVGVFSTTDPDQNLGHVYSFAFGEGGDQNDEFTLDGAILRTAGPLNFEEGETRSIRIRSTDIDEGFFEKTFTITVTDANDAPSIVVLSHYGIQEGLPVGSLVGMLGVEDEDGDTDFSFSLAAGEGDVDNSSFSIQADELLGMETFSVLTKEFYQVRLRAEQEGSGLSVETPAVIYVTEPVLWDNGYIATGVGNGVDGADTSAMQTGENIYGSSVVSPYRLAENFTVDAPAGWLVRDVVAYAYQTGSTTTSTLTSMNVRIWDGPPNDPESTVVFGDTETNRLSQTAWTGIFRITNPSTLGESGRPVMRAEAQLGPEGVVLPQGSYWVDWQMTGSLFSGPWVPNVTVAGRSIEGNALQSNVGTWGPALNNTVQKEMPFRLLGERLNAAPGLHQHAGAASPCRRAV